MTLAFDWVSECLLNHADCSAPGQNFLPQRLLHVTNTVNHLTITDTETDQHGSKPYAALSYCWGGDQQFKTTKENLNVRTRDPLILPKTIQDAVCVTRRLGLEYLWVDSMCIIQDDEEDKADQVSQMHKIFENAFVTIASTCATGCKDGFLYPRRGIDTFRVHMEFADGASGSVVLFPKAPRGRDEPLSKRAWTLQETMLSRRILSYGSRQMRWFCKGMTRSHGGAKLDPDYAIEASFRPVSEMMVDLPKMRKNSRRMRVDPTSLPWTELVEAYTQRSLSVPADKLIAISAIAQSISDTIPWAKTGYFAGTWRERFIEQLLWSMSTREIGPRPAEHRAPSWSWASVDGRPKWPSVEILAYANISCKLIEANVSPISSVAPFGAVKAGHIKVHGRIKPARLSRDQRSMEDLDTGARITDGVIHTFPDAIQAVEKEMIVHVMELTRPSRLYSTMSALKVPAWSRWHNYAGALVLEQHADNVYSRIGFLGFRSNHLLVATSWARVENKTWWSIGFESKTITII